MYHLPSIVQSMYRVAMPAQQLYPALLDQCLSKFLDFRTQNFLGDRHTVHYQAGIQSFVQCLNLFGWEILACVTE